MGNLPTIIIAALGLIGTIYAVYDLYKKRSSAASISVVSSAVELLKPYKEEVKILRADLQKAHVTIKNLNEQLDKTQNRADELNSQLVDAQATVGYLKVQVRILSDQLREVNGE